MTLIRNHKFLWALILILAALNLIFLGVFWKTRDQGQAGIPGQRPDRYTTFLPDRLEFNQNQQIRFSAMRESHRAELRVLMNAIRIQRDSLRNLLSLGAPAEEALGVSTRIGDLQTELEMLNYEHFLEVLSICSEEQKETMLSLMGNAFRPSGHQEMRRERRQRGRNFSPGP